MKVVIIGSGIAGLAAALALRGAGCEVTVVERNDPDQGTGAGIALGPNALAGLRELGLEHADFGFGARADLRVVRSSRGAIITQGPFGGGAVRRAELRGALLKQAGDAVRFGRGCVGVLQDTRGAIVKCAQGDDEEADAVVAADGLRSTIRAQLFGDAGPVYRGATSWRGIARVEHEIVTGKISESWGRGQRIGLQGMAKGWIYWWATRNAAEGSAEFAKFGVAELLDLFRSWHEPVERVLSATVGDVVHTDLYDCDPLPRWSIGRVTLAGDAAHAMTPDLGQGAAQAIEDALALAAALRKNRDDVDSAFMAYEHARREVAYSVMRRARRHLVMGQLEDPVACFVRNKGVRFLPKAVQVALGVRRPTAAPSGPR